MTVGVFRIGFTKQNAGEPVDFQPFHFVYFTILGSALGLLVGGVSGGLDREVFMQWRDTDDQIRRVGPTRRSPHERLRLVLRFGPIWWDCPRHALSVPLCRLTTGKRCGLRGRGLGFLSRSRTRASARRIGIGTLSTMKSLGKITKGKGDA